MRLNFRDLEKFREIHEIQNVTSSVSELFCTSAGGYRYLCQLASVELPNSWTVQRTSQVI